MTSAKTFQGMAGDKNSSRVLAPPGGGSSNIFGVADDNTQNNQAAPRVRKMDDRTPDQSKFEHVPISAADNKKRQQQGSGIFGDTVDEPRQNASKSADQDQTKFEHVPISAADNKKRQQEGSGIFGDAEEPKKNVTKGTGTRGTRSERDIGNPLTGKGYSNGVSPVCKSTSKIRGRGNCNPTNDDAHLNPITFGKNEEGTAEELLKNSPSTRKGQGVFRPAATGNPLTGEGYQAEPAAKSAGRVNHPPGGASTALW